MDAPPSISSILLKFVKLKKPFTLIGFSENAGMFDVMSKVLLPKNANALEDP